MGEAALQLIEEETPTTSGDVLLTRAMVRVAEVMLDPAYIHATQEEKAAAAGITPRHWRRLAADQRFGDIFSDILRQMVRERLNAVMSASYQTAAMPGREGYQDRKLLAEMGGWTPTERHISEGGIAVEYVSDWRSGGQPGGDK